MPVPESSPIDPGVSEDRNVEIIGHGYKRDKNMSLAIHREPQNGTLYRV